MITIGRQEQHPATQTFENIVKF